MDESQLDISEIRAAIHDIKLKDAITRQDLMKSERENSLLKNQIAKTRQEIDKLEKDLKKDQKLLESQENNIVTAKLDIFNRKKTKKNDSNLLKESIERENQLIKDLHKRHIECLNFLSTIRKKSSYLELALKDTKNSNDIMGKMREFINYYEEHIALLDSTTKNEEIIYQEELNFYNQQYLLYEKELRELDGEHLNEMKKLYELENRSNLSESDKVIYSKNVDVKTEQIALSSAEAILARLREKLGNSEVLGGIVTKLDSQLSKHKKKIIHVDLS